ncbi:MAG TPA: hypothetical protein VNF29_15190 [Candidatus Binataceae bacterium]|nr:hypothetical protein [Candidatus Binataceae bacterium]
MRTVISAANLMTLATGAREPHEAAAPPSGDAPVTLINLPSPDQSAQESEADDQDSETLRIPEFDARLSINPAILAAQ